MIRIGKVLAVLCLFVASLVSAQTVNVTADVKSIFAANPGDAKVRVCLSLTDLNEHPVPQAIVTGGSGILVQDKNVCVTPTSGHVSTVVYANDQISVGGVASSTKYVVTWYLNNAPVHSASYIFNASDITESLNTKLPLGVPPVVTPPTGDTTYARLDFGNGPFTAPISAPATNGVINAALQSGVDICAKINTAIAAFGAPGGKIVVPSGAYTCSTSPNADQTVDIWIEGAGGQTAGSLASTVITYTGIGNFISARSSTAFHLSNIQILWSNPSFAGLVVDFSHAGTGCGGGGCDTTWAEIDHCSFFKNGSGALAPVVINFDKTINSSFHHNSVQSYVVGIRGAIDSTSYSNAIALYHNNFSSSTGTAVTAHILNPLQSWTVDHNTFEMGNAAGTPAIISTTTGTAVNGLKVTNNWIGDHFSAATYIHYDFSASTIAGGLFFAGNFDAGTATSTDIKLPDNSDAVYIGNSVGPFANLFDLGGVNDKVDIGTANILIGSVPTLFATNQPGFGYGISAAGLIEMWSRGGMTLRSTSDATMDIKIIPGFSADQKATWQFTDRNGAMQWQWIKDATNNAEFQDSASRNRLLFSAAETSVDAPNGSGSVVINDSANSGTGGLNVCSGGASPTCHVADITGAGLVKGTTFGTETICAAVGTAASPSVASCTAAPAGSFSCATNATGATCVVNTTAVTVNSQIFVTEDETLGTRLGVTCNTGTTVVPTSRLIAARSAGVSFTINLGTVTTNPACFSYSIIN